MSLPFNYKNPESEDVNITLCYWLALKSHKHHHEACIITDHDGLILSTGISQQIDSSKTEDDFFIKHAPVSALEKTTDKYPSKVYMSGVPCPTCAKILVGRGIKHLVYGHMNFKTDYVNFLAKLPSMYQYKKYEGNSVWMKDYIKWLEVSYPAIFE